MTNQQARDDFHSWLLTQGFKQFTTPPRGGHYPSSRVDEYWGVWLAATLAAQHRQPHMPAQHKEPQ
jgi:hypothetical protein